MKQYTALLALAACLSYAIVTAAQVSDLTDEERKLLEESLAADAAEPAHTTPSGGSHPSTSSNPNISLILDTSAAWFNTDAPPQLGAHDPSKTGFNLQQVELHMDSNVDPFFRMDANIVFAQFGVEVEEAFLTTLALPGNLQVRAGQFLTRFGRLNATHPHAWHFVDQPLVNGKFLGGEGSRGLGTELSWLVPLPWFVQLTGSATDAAGECCARSFFGGEDLGVDGPEDLLYTARLEQFFDATDSWSILLGASTQLGPNPTGQGNRTELYAADLLIRWRPLDAPHRTAVWLQVEAVVRQRQAPFRLLRDYGGYAELVWHIDTEWETGLRQDLVTGVENDPLDPDWVDTRNRSTAQVTWHPSHFSRLRLQGSYSDPEEAVAVFLAIEVLIGAHGAHSY